MSLRPRVKARLAIKFPGVNLSNKRTNAIAAGLDKKLGDEATDEEIDERLDDLNEAFPFAEYRTEQDRLRSLEAEKRKDPADEEDEKTDPKEPKKKEVEPPATEPKGLSADDVAAIVLKAMSPLMTEITSLKSDKVATSRKSKVEEILKGKDEKFKKLSEKAFTKMKFETEDEFNEYLEELEEDAAEFVQSESETKLAGSVKPIAGFNKNVKVKKISDTEADSILNSIV